MLRFCHLFATWSGRDSVDADAPLLTLSSDGTQGRGIDRALLAGRGLGCQYRSKTCYEPLVANDEELQAGKAAGGDIDGQQKGR